MWVSCSRHRPRDRRHRQGNPGERDRQLPRRRPDQRHYANTMWFTMTGSNQIGEIRRRDATLVGMPRHPTPTPTAITLGPDGNKWFTSGTGNPAWIGAVVLNPGRPGHAGRRDHPAHRTSRQTQFGGFNYGFGIRVAVENSAGQIDPFVQQGTITIAIDPTEATGAGRSNGGDPDPAGQRRRGPLRRPDDQSPGIRATTIQATYSLGLNTPVSRLLQRDGPGHEIGRDHRTAAQTSAPASSSV